MDLLTQLYSRKDLEDLLNNGEISLSNYSSLIFFDIDSLIAINDLYSYMIADKYLQQLGLILKKYFKEPDLCFRYRGDEFIVLVKDNANIEELAKNIINDSIDKNCIIDVTYSNNKFYSISGCIIKNLASTNHTELELEIDDAITAIHNKKDHIENRKYKNQGVLAII